MLWSVFVNFGERLSAAVVMTTRAPVRRKVLSSESMPALKRAAYFGLQGLMRSPWYTPVRAPASIQITTVGLKRSTIAASQEGLQGVGGITVPLGRRTGCAMSPGGNAHPGIPASSVARV